MHLTANFSCLILCLLCSLVEEVHSQTVPFVSFMGEILPNHAYVDLTAVGRDISDPGDTVRCHTDLESCCTGIHGHNGKWYYPNQTSLGSFRSFYDSYAVQSRESNVVHIRVVKPNYVPTSGIYHCEIETVAVHDNDANSITGETVYVGLYATGGNQSIIY